MNYAVDFQVRISQFNNFLEEMVVYFQYTRGLQFEEKPDYKYLSALFKTICDKYQIVFDNMYDWYILSQKKREENENSNNELKGKDIYNDIDANDNINGLKFEKDKLTNNNSNLSNVGSIKTANNNKASKFSPTKKKIEKLSCFAK